MALELYNSTVIEWLSTASLSLPYIPSLTTIFVVRSRFLGGLPEGLRTDLSPSVVDVEFVASDLGGPLPDDLDGNWPSVLMLYLEHCKLQEFPPAIARMKLTDLSLVDNNISVVPDRRELFYLSFQYTNIASLPPWLQDLRAEGADINFRALGTPYCHDLPLNSSEAVFAACNWDDCSHGIFPLATRDQARAIRDYRN